MEQFWRIGDFAKKVGKHGNTVDGWFKQLEDSRIHYVGRAGNEKVYDELDLQIAHYIKLRRGSKPPWALEAIFQSLSNEIELRPFPEAVESTSESQVLDIEGLKKALQAEFQVMAQQAAHEAAQQVAAATVQALPDPAQQRNERMNEHMTGKRIERQLKREALDLWEKKPVAERMKKVGLFKKEEDGAARERFILDYLDDHYEARMRHAYGL